MNVSSGHSHQTHTSLHLASSQFAQVSRKPVSVITFQSTSGTHRKPLFFPAPEFTANPQQFIGPHM